MKKFLILLVFATLCGGANLHAQRTNPDKIKVFFCDPSLKWEQSHFYIDVYESANSVTDTWPGVDVTNNTIEYDNQTWYYREFDISTYGDYVKVIFVNDDGNGNYRSQSEDVDWDIKGSGGIKNDSYFKLEDSWTDGKRKADYQVTYYLCKTDDSERIRLDKDGDNYFTTISLQDETNDVYYVVLNPWGFGSYTTIDWNQKNNIYRPSPDKTVQFEIIEEEEVKRNQTEGSWKFCKGAQYDFSIVIEGWESKTYSVAPFIEKTIANNEKNLGTFSADGKTAIPAGVTAYIGKLNGEAVTLEEISGAIPANTGILYKGTTAGETVKFYATNDAAASVTDNVLEATGSAGKNLSVGDYVLATIDGQDLGFYPVNAAVAAYGPFKAYIPSESVSAAKLAINFGDETGIANLSHEKTDNVYYDLQGRRVMNPTKGLFIVNGKKVIK